MTQIQRVYELLLDKKFHCVTEMLAMYIPDYRKVLCEIRYEGVVMEGKPCTMHTHQSKNLKMWRIL